ncbi:pentatricopeptide repeat-containing protein At3g26782, mitochondrial [Cryptomeria japonica]|uniref:pentatricopeptide repeat-containing protein At3g26782, mitochondrial n=1 Tax=Cryptomeria japonica TaxID=3369 RepID=UPI0025ABD978|nr:pentatricopeptide repeat-containing protein At3g26782, mitochondrial [Cryptomeria japonica]XP_057847937.1 pentatricopeptide repeat-containing protein At3g26782, mitochondrial [Cryptomeria japonica]
MSSIGHFNLNLRALCKEGRLKDAMHILLTTQNPPVDTNTYLQLLQTCVTKKALLEGKQIHSHINDRGFPIATRTLLHNKAINMYDKCGSLVDARKAFDLIAEPDVFSWNMIIAAYRRHGLAQEAFTLFHQMPTTGVQPDLFTFASILPVCTKMGSLELGMEIHQRITESGFLSDDVVVTSLIDMYAKCGSINKAHELFDKMPRRDAVSWNAIIGGYNQNGLPEKAMEVFKNMEIAAVNPTSGTFASILPACAKLGNLAQGMEIHARVIESGFLSDVVVRNSLIALYSKCGSIRKAYELFDKMAQQDAVSWTTIIAGYVQNGLVGKALDVFKQMQFQGVMAISATFASVLRACAKMGALNLGMEIHKKIIETEFLSDDVVVTALVDVYAKCGSMRKARELFERMPQQDLVSWTAIISGYVQNGLVEKALDFFKQMQFARVKPDASTLASILPACAKLGALDQGIEIHLKIIENGYLSDVVVANALIDMYAKCGIIQKARKLFDRMHNANLVSWTAMFAGYAMHGYSKDAFKLFELMKYSGTNPDHISFVCILYACSHAGLVDEGCRYFYYMSDTYSIMPTMDHYVCMVDLLGRAGYLEETLNFIIKMSRKPDVVVWMCLLGTSRSHKNIELGEFVASLLFELYPKNPAPYVLLSNIYAEAGMWSDLQKIRKLMKDRGIKKIPGCSWIEVNKNVHVFCVGDRSHPQTQEIYAILEKLNWETKTTGYMPDTGLALNDVEEEEKKSSLSYHSEKLAIAFGLLSTPPGTTIRVVKNLRVCVDCHTASKFISKIVDREIVVRDANRFHHFKCGQCSCGDYW